MGSNDCTSFTVACNPAITVNIISFCLDIEIKFYMRAISTRHLLGLFVLDYAPLFGGVYRFFLYPIEISFTSFVDRVDHCRRWKSRDGHFNDSRFWPVLRNVCTHWSLAIHIGFHFLLNIRRELKFHQLAHTLRENC